MERGTASV
uniref:Uncharacterized protein n=1 Tax=Arundo donax TaxID=35708 RepID=A0A0A9FZA4_ARUDO